MNTQPSLSMKNQPPGTIAYTGTYTDVPLSMVLYRYSPSDWSKTEIQSIEEVPDDETIKWLNVTGLSHTHVIRSIGERFDIDPLILEDIVNVAQYSKMQTEENLLFSVWKMVYKKHKQIEHEHVSILLADNWVITFQENEGDVFDSVRDRIERNMGILRTMKGDYLTFALIDSIIDHYFDTVSLINRQFDTHEAMIFDQEKITMDSLYPLRKELAKLKSAVFPMKTAPQKVLHGKRTVLSEDVHPYFHDALDNLMQVSEQILTLRELSASLHDRQLSELSHQMNTIMTTLTIFSAVFIPLSFIAGVFGTNFRQMPGINSPQAFMLFLIACVAVAALMLTFFKRKKWF